MLILDHTPFHSPACVCVCTRAQGSMLSSACLLCVLFSFPSSLTSLTSNTATSCHSLLLRLPFGIPTQLPLIDHHACPSYKLPTPPHTPSGLLRAGVCAQHQCGGRANVSELQLENVLLRACPAHMLCINSAVWSASFWVAGVFMGVADDVPHRPQHIHVWSATQTCRGSATAPPNHTS